MKSASVAFLASSSAPAQEALKALRERYPDRKLVLGGVGGCGDFLGTVECLSEVEGVAGLGGGPGEVIAAPHRNVGDLAELLHELVALLLQQVAALFGQLQLGAASQQLGSSRRHLFHEVLSPQVWVR